MAKDLATVLLDGVPPLYSAAQNGDAHGALVAIRRLIGRVRELDADLARELKSRLPTAPVAEAIRRAEPTPFPSEPVVPPVDVDSSAGLLKRIDTTGARAPVLARPERDPVAHVLREQRAASLLERAGLAPRSTLFLVGPPGVGKTMTAAWLAQELQLPLFQVELSWIVSSFLGRTGQNLRQVFDFARAQSAVILLDEFDAIAKRRDDGNDLGEAKRMVSVLLKEIEEWSGPSILVAATNHPDLIDPAVFRRFQVVVHVKTPGPAEAREILRLHLASLAPASETFELAADLLVGSSGSRIRDVALDARRAAAIDSGVSADAALLRALAHRARTTRERRALAQAIHSRNSKLTFSELAGLLDVSKGTIHNYLKREADDE